jgi:hypothetical protein
MIAPISPLCETMGLRWPRSKVGGYVLGNFTTISGQAGEADDVRR